MKRATLKNALTAFVVTTLIAACGGVTEDTPLVAQQPSQEASPPSHVTAQNYPPYDPDYHCLVSQSYVPCFSGHWMNTYWSSEWGHYIERDVCANYGGPLVCPY